MTNVVVANVAADQEVDGGTQFSLDASTSIVYNGSSTAAASTCLWTQPIGAPALSSLTSFTPTGTAPYVATRTAFDYPVVVKDGSGTASTNTIFQRVWVLPAVGGTDPAPAASIPNYATSARPAATSVQVGASYYDTTLLKPAWSDGAAWRDATGTAV